MSVHITDELAEQLGLAQWHIYRHLTGCPSCATNRHCDERNRAEALFRHHGLLPRRVPGLTRQPPDDWGTP